MPHITVNYRMYLPAAHHRQPRNANIDLSLAPAAGGDTPFTPPFFPQLPYTLPAPGGGSGMAKLLFWNITDGTTGKVQSPTPFDIPTAASPLSVTAWYYPTSGPAVVGGPGTSIIDDAFSAAAGTFIDDTFVVVNGDPNSQLTSDANVIGTIPTLSSESLFAKSPVPSTSEPFSQWILNDSLMPINNATLLVPATTTGIAIAVYQQGPRAVVPPSNPNQYNQGGGIIIGGVKVDGGGWIIINGVPHPVDPWGPLIASLANSAVITVEARNMNKSLGAQVMKLAAQDALHSIKQSMGALEKQAGE